MINYQYISQAIDFYTQKGFKFIEVPWVVSDHAVSITKPPGATKFPFGNEGFLVASGEQSFLELILQKKLNLGWWGCVTPCFRDDILDKYHQRYFLKVELIGTELPDKRRLGELVLDCLKFFQSIIPGSQIVNTEPPDPLLKKGTGYDIVSPNGIELGSYGIRSHPDIGQWIYATGCAEPRLSIALKEIEDAKTNPSS